MNLTKISLRFEFSFKLVTMCPLTQMLINARFRNRLMKKPATLSFVDTSIVSEALRMPFDRPSESPFLIIIKVMHNGEQVSIGYSENVPRTLQGNFKLFYTIKIKRHTLPFLYIISDEITLEIVIFSNLFGMTVKL